MSASEALAFINGATSERERIIGLLNRPNRLLTKVYLTENGLGWLAENDLNDYLKPKE